MRLIQHSLKASLLSNEWVLNLAAGGESCDVLEMNEYYVVEDVWSGGEAMRFQRIGPGEVRAYLQRPDVQVIDLREQEEYEKLHLKGAICIPYDQLEQSMDRLNRQKKLFLYCEHGSLSLYAARMLAGKGYETISLIGGFFSLRQKKID